MGRQAAVGLRRVLDKKGGDRWWKEGFLYLVLHVSKVCHLLSRLADTATALLAEVIRRSCLPS